MFRVLMLIVLAAASPAALKEARRLTVAYIGLRTLSKAVSGPRLKALIDAAVGEA